MPTLQRKYNTYEQFAAAPFATMFDKDIQDTMLTRQVTTTTSCVLLNDGSGRFAIKDLPNHAQIAPMMGTCLLDINDDGNLDIITVGNMYGADREIVKYDAGKGLLMLGDGAGGFAALSPSESGFSVDADARSMVVIGSVKDGTRQLAVFANQAAPYLYKISGSGELVPGTDGGGMMVLANGGKRKFENNYGGSYISDQPKWIYKSASVKSLGNAQTAPALRGR